MLRNRFYLIIVSLLPLFSQSQITNVGSGSYTNNFPGVDAAARNLNPSGSPQISGNALGKPVPTSDWWAGLVANNHVTNLFNYPLGMKTINDGLVVSYSVPSSGPTGSKTPLDDTNPIVVGVSGLNASKCTVSDYSDWTVTMAWNDASHDFYAISGMGMPFLYFTKKTSDIAQIKVNSGSVVITNEMMVITDAKNGADFAVYAPTGSTWVQNGTTYTSSLNGQNFWSMVMIPPTASNNTTTANEYKKHAFVFPKKTTVQWNYNESNSKMTSTYKVEVDVKQGTDTTVLMGLLPHQWDHLAASSAVPSGFTYPTVRGTMKMLNGNTFTVENTFRGVLPTMPNVVNYSPTFSAATMNSKISQIENDGLATWTDSYNEGQVFNRLIQTARIADQMGNITARDKMVATVKERLENWLKASPGEVAFIFYYNSTWSSIIGYPAGHGQDNGLNDKHFHWGYFLNAAAFVEQYNPGWASQWNGMVDLLVRDAASIDRNDNKFPFLRNFNPYAGHAWADGFTVFPFGSNQESSSESMNFNASLIHWGEVTNNKPLRDLGIYLYTTEKTAIDEYWFDVNNRTFKPGYANKIVSRIWGNGYDNQTFWTSDIAAVYGIEMYPMTANSLYLAHNLNYVQTLWNEMKQTTGVLRNEANDNLWHDVYWEYLSFIDPKTAIDMYNSFPKRNLKFGISDAQTYHWLHSINAAGKVKADITANYPIAAAFYKGDTITYVAHNYSATPLTVAFSDGYQLKVPPYRMASSKDITATGVLFSDFKQAYADGSVNLSVSISGSGITKVKYFDGDREIASQTTTPFTFRAERLTLGIHKFYVKMYVGELLGVSNIVDVQVGEQVPYLGIVATIPGVIQPGNYDSFEGGIGQGISYTDVSQNNEGNFRLNESADAELAGAEGATIAHIASGEWLEYTVDIKTTGGYNLAFRYASANSAGGGPFYLELDGKKISGDIAVANTNGWSTWATKNVANIELVAGKHILRLVFKSGEFNLGKLTFTYTNALGYKPPIAHAGTNVKVLLPATSGTLNGSLSNSPDGKPITYAWEQIYGPSIITFNNKTTASPQISNLEKGIYKCELKVSDGTYTGVSDVLIIVTSDANIQPFAAITSPAVGSKFFEGKNITISANASDLDGTIALVEFYANGVKIGESATNPYSVGWNKGIIDNHTLTVVATDNGGAKFTSAGVNIQVTPGPSCIGGPDNKDYTYKFSDAKSNPTITFVPSASGVGSPTCLFYYSTNATGPFPGYAATANTPFPITAAEGTTIYFYYTYSYPGGERNTSLNKHSYEIGSCVATVSSYVTASTNAISMAVGANSTFVFTVSSNVNWGLASNQTWLTASATSGTGNKEITLTAQANSSLDSRLASITLTAAGVASKTILVTQAGLTTGISNWSKNECAIYPNPASEILFVDCIGAGTWITIADMRGHIFYSQLNNGNQVDVSQLPSGMYTLRISDNTGVMVRKFIK